MSLVFFCGGSEVVVTSVVLFAAVSASDVVGTGSGDALRFRDGGEGVEAAKAVRGASTTSTMMENRVTIQPERFESQTGALAVVGREMKK